MTNGERVSRHIPTLGMEIPHEFSKGKNRKILWDTAGMDDFGGIRDGYAIKSDVVLIFVDKNPESTIVALEYLENVRRCAPKVEVVLIINKIDLDYDIPVKFLSKIEKAGGRIFAFSAESPTAENDAVKILSQL